MANNFPLPPILPPPPSAVLPPPEENPVIPPAYQAPQPAVAPVKPSIFKFVTPIIIAVVALSIVIFIITRLFLGSKSTNVEIPETAPVVTLNYWGLWETPDIMAPVITAFETANPNIKVNYQLQSHQDYQDRLQTVVTGNASPDVARIHSTWLPLLIRNLLPAPANTVSVTEIQTNYYPVVGSSVVINNQLYGVPMSLDGLVLFINTDMLKQANLSAPVTWEDLRTTAKTLTIRDSVTNKITRAGVALGNTSNVRLWPDIVSTMLLQGGVNLLSPNTKTVSDILSYYTSFSATGQFWDETMPDSVTAFANGKVAIIFAPLWIVPELQAINPNLIWQTAPIPQLPDAEPITWASMWIEAVPKNAPHPQEAWKLVSFLASADAQQLLFESAIKNRNFAQIPANKAVARLVSQNPVDATLLSGLGNAKTFYTASMTHDNNTALNSRLIKYLEDAVNSISTRQDPTKVVDVVSQGFNQILSQYRLANPLPTLTPR